MADKQKHKLVLMRTVYLIFEFEGEGDRQETIDANAAIVEHAKAEITQLLDDRLCGDSLSGQQLEDFDDEDVVALDWDQDWEEADNEDV